MALCPLVPQHTSRSGIGCRHRARRSNRPVQRLCTDERVVGPRSPASVGLTGLQAEPAQHSVPSEYFARGSSPTEGKQFTSQERPRDTGEADGTWRAWVGVDVRARPPRTRVARRWRPVAAAKAVARQPAHCVPCWGPRGRGRRRRAFRRLRCRPRPALSTIRVCTPGPAREPRALKQARDRRGR